MSATFVITIKADTAGVTGSTSRVERDLEKVKQKALEVNKTIRQVFGIFAIREMVTGLYNLVDTYTTLRNKLNVVAKDQNNLNGIMGATFKVAQETRSSWASTAQMFSRMAMNSKQLGVSQQELIGFTKSLNQAIIVGGATSTEASAGLLQLSQGMASGALKGDELRAVLEQLPVVADVIAKKFGVTRGELRKMGTDGKITGRDIIIAFKQSAKEIDEAFKKTAPTMGQSFEMIRNAATKFFGEAGTGSGVLAALAAALKFVADNMDTIGKVILAVGQAFLSLMIIKTVISLLRALWVVFATNPLTAFIMVITTGILLLRQFGDQISTGIPIWTNVKGVFISVGDVLKVLWEDFKKLISVIGEFIEFAWNQLTSSLGDGLPTDGIELSLRNVLVFIAGFIGSAVGLFTQFKEKGLEVFGGFAVSAGEAFIEVGRMIAKVFETIINGIIDSLNSVSTTLFGSVANPAKIQAAINAGEKQGLQGADLLKYVRSQDLGGSKGPQISRADFDFENTLSGAGDATVGLMKEGLEEARAEGKAWMDSMNSYIDSVVDRAHDIGAKRVMNEKQGGVDGYVSTEPGEFQAAGKGKGAKKVDEWAKLVAKLDSLIKKSNDATEAQMQLEEASAFLDKGAKDKDGVYHTILGELEKRGITAGTIMDDLHQKLDKIAYPMDAWVTEQIEAAAAMKGTNAEYEHTKAVMATVNDLTERGAELTAVQVSEIDRVTQVVEDRTRAWEREKAIIQGLRSPYDEYRLNLESIRKLYKDGEISAREYNLVLAQQTLALNSAAKAARATELEYQALTDPVEAGAGMGLESLKEHMMGAAAAVRDGMMEMMTALESFILTAVETGKFEWETLVESIFKSLDRIALKIIEQWIMMKVFGAATGVPVGGMPTLPAMPGGDGSDAGFGGGYANGGTYMVPGSGGPDSQRIAFDLTPGERVDFTPPGQSARSTPPVEYGSIIAQMAASVADAVNNVKSGGGSGPAKVSVHNHIDRSELLSSIDTKEGEQAVINVLRKNPGAIRSILQR